MELLQINQLKRGYGINHSEHGFLQYRGLVPINIYSDKPKVPNQYLFWKPVDENGDNQPDVILHDGKISVEVIDKIEEYE